MKQLIFCIVVFWSAQVGAQNKSVLGTWEVSNTTQSQCLDVKDNHSTPCPANILRPCWTIVFEADGTYKYLNMDVEVIGTYSVQGEIVKLKNKKTGDSAHFVFDSNSGTLSYTLPDTGESCKTVFTFRNLR